jgi:plasmid stabilization system protein ParE
VVKNPAPLIIWNNNAIKFLKKALDRIKEDSPQNAENVRTGIMKIVDNLPDHPEKFPKDIFKNNNDGTYRAFEKFSFRIAYKISPKQIKILRVRYVKQEPKSY